MADDLNTARTSVGEQGERRRYVTPRLGSGASVRELTHMNLTGSMNDGGTGTNPKRMDGP
jgi:hypothetical protein